MRAVNLIPAGERRGAPVGAGRSGGAAYVVLGALGVLALLVVLFGLARHQVSDRKSQLALVTAQTQRAQEEASALTPYTSFATLREQRTQAVEQVVDSRFDWAHAFHELGRVLPRDASIGSLDGTIGAGSTTTSTSSSTTAGAAGATTGASSATPPGSVPIITLGGCATSQSEVALTLQRLRLMDGVSAVDLQSSAKGGSSAAGASSGNCQKTSAAFTARITFDPLPTPTASSGGSSTQLTASTGGGQ